MSYFLLMLIALIEDFLFYWDDSRGEKIIFVKKVVYKSYFFFAYTNFFLILFCSIKREKKINFLIQNQQMQIKIKSMNIFDIKQTTVRWMTCTWLERNRQN